MTKILSKILILVVLLLVLPTEELQAAPKPPRPLVICSFLETASIRFLNDIAAKETNLTMRQNSQLARWQKTEIAGNNRLKNLKQAELKRLNETADKIALLAQNAKQENAAAAFKDSLAAAVEKRQGVVETALRDFNSEIRQAAAAQQAAISDNISHLKNRVGTIITEARADCENDILTITALREKTRRNLQTAREDFIAAGNPSLFSAALTAARTKKLTALKIAGEDFTEDVASAKNKLKTGWQ